MLSFLIAGAVLIAALLGGVAVEGFGRMRPISGNGRTRRLQLLSAGTEFWQKVMSEWHKRHGSSP